MADGWNERYQLMLRVVATAVWWMTRVHLSEKGQKDFTPETVARTLPGFIPDK